jgi:hypothetical protein
MRRKRSRRKILKMKMRRKSTQRRQPKSSRKPNNDRGEFKRRNLKLLSRLRASSLSNRIQLNPVRLDLASLLKRLTE